MTSLVRMLSLIVFVASCGGSWSVFADESADRARDVLDRAASALGENDAFAVSGVLKYTGKFGDDSEVLDTDYVLAFERPDRVSLHILNREIEIFFYLDDENLTRYIPEYKQFLIEGHDTTPAAFIAEAGFEMIAPVMRLLGELAATEPFGANLAATELEYVGEEEIGVAVDRVRFASGEYTYDVWVRKDNARIRRIEADMTPMEEKYSAEYGITFDLTVTAELEEWSFGESVGDKLAFNPPADVEEVEGAFSPPRPLTPAEQLVGQKAPDFTLPLLEGGEVTLSELQGQIVILDFWATWCGPCRVAMPVLETVSKEFADQGVAMYGINLQESPEQIRAFLDSQGIELTVALETTGAVAGQYRVEGIPMTVIVDAEGNVAIVHVGLWAMPVFEQGQSPEDQDAAFKAVLADALRDELRELIASSN